jgi:plasmid maintenance system antidote protein VapI
MIRKITKGQKETTISPGGGYGKMVAEESGILVVPDDMDFYGVFLTDSMLLELGYQPIPVDKEQCDDNGEMFDPEWVSPPGSSLSNLLEEYDISVSLFSSRMQMSEEEIELLLKGDVELTREIAEKIADEFDGNVDFWIERERRYREGIERGKKKII